MTSYQLWVSNFFPAAMLHFKNKNWDLNYLRCIGICFLVSSTVLCVFPPFENMQWTRFCAVCGCCTGGLLGTEATANVAAAVTQTVGQQLCLWDPDIGAGERAPLSCGCAPPSGDPLLCWDLCWYLSLDQKLDPCNQALEETVWWLRLNPFRSLLRGRAMHSFFHWWFICVKAPAHLFKRKSALEQNCVLGRENTHDCVYVR